MSLHKAKRIDTGEWVTGNYFEGNQGHYILKKKNPILQDTQGLNPFTPIEIDPSTLCQQVPTTGWFVGDEVENEEGIKGFIIFNEMSIRYEVDVKEDAMYWSLSVPNWKPTGKNKHDDE
jgi:hypothetical protein